LTVFGGLLSNDLAIDLGTASTLVYSKKDRELLQMNRLLLPLEKTMLPAKKYLL